MSKSKIEWCEQTWNPVIGCSNKSAGCDNCYAEKMAYRLACMGTRGYTEGIVLRCPVNGPRWTGKTVFVKSEMQKPLRRQKPTLYFVSSMGDLFHESVPDIWICRVWDVMRQCSVRAWENKPAIAHRFMVLTKRPERMADFCRRVRFDRDRPAGRRVFMDDPGERTAYPLMGSGALKNVALGVTAENQDMADERIPILLATPAAKRFVSIEPMLGPVSLYPETGAIMERAVRKMEAGFPKEAFPLPDHLQYDGPPSVDLIIVGGESGPRARPMHAYWAQGVRDQCKAAGVPFMFKQWGSGVVDRDLHLGAGWDPTAPAGGRILNGQTHDGTIDWGVA